MYQEWKNDILLSDILSNVDGDKYSIIGEGIYERQFEAGRLGGGLKHTQCGRITPTAERLEDEPR